MIGSAKERDGLYYFDDGPNFSKQCPNTCLNSTLFRKMMKLCYGIIVCKTSSYSFFISAV
ncbi:hypothetical protein CR513_43234, partial [Mucuna pruriens]